MCACSIIPVAKILMSSKASFSGQGSSSTARDSHVPLVFKEEHNLGGSEGHRGVVFQ
jgi:hypothetical protein